LDACAREIFEKRKNRLFSQKSTDKTRQKDHAKDPCALEKHSPEQKGLAIPPRP
jgi:hypothetical protein